MWIPPIPETDLPDHRLIDGKWHVGCMVTQKRAVIVASELFPDEIADGVDCKAEIGNKGNPCRYCAERNQSWAERVAQVRNAMIKSMGA